MHALEKILARAGGVEYVAAGDIINAEVDLAMVHDRGGPRVMDLLIKNHTPRVKIPEKIMVFFDHDVPATKINSAVKQRVWRLFMQEHKIERIYDVGSGVSHIVMLQNGHIAPGNLVVGTDSHTTSGGAIGAAATGIGETEMAAVFLTGAIWLKVPKIIKINLSGKIQKGVATKDICLKLLQTIDTDQLIYTAIEFSGTLIGEMSISDRMVLSSMSVELGAKFGYIEPDSKTSEYCQSKGIKHITPYYTDKDYQYKEIINLNVDDLKPLVALPHGFDEIVPVSEAPTTAIDQAVIGSCSGGRLEDLKIAANILKGKKVNGSTRLIITPGSREIYQQALNEGIMQTLVEAGAAVNMPRCGPCGSACDGLIGAGERCLTNANRNFKGRLGSPEANIYLASTYTVAASAVEGKLVDPLSVI